MLESSLEGWKGSMNDSFNPINDNLFLLTLDSTHEIMNFLAAVDTVWFSSALRSQFYHRLS